MALVSGVLSLGAKHTVVLPWQVVAHLPLLENISSSRFVLVTYLCVAVSLAVIVDHCRTAVIDRYRAVGHGHSGARGHWVAGAAGVAVAAVALVPSAVYLSSSLPFTTQPVGLPTWFTTVAPHLNRSQVVLVLPAPFGVTQSSMTWQAVDGMSFSMAGQGGPAGVVERAGAERAGQTAITDATFFFSPTQTITAAGAAAVRQALHGWGVTTVVIPDQPRLPAYERIRSVTNAAALMTAATGTRPVHQADAWVWSGVSRAGPWAAPTTATLFRCTAGVGYDGGPAVDAATACVLAAMR